MHFFNLYIYSYFDNNASIIQEAIVTPSTQTALRFEFLHGFSILTAGHWHVSINDMPKYTFITCRTATTNYPMVTFKLNRIFSFLLISFHWPTSACDDRRLGVHQAYKFKSKIKSKCLQKWIQIIGQRMSIPSNDFAQKTWLYLVHRRELIKEFHIGFGQQIMIAWWLICVCNILAMCYVLEIGQL